MGNAGLSVEELVHLCSLQTYQGVRNVCLPVEELVQLLPMPCMHTLHGCPDHHRSAS